MGDTELSKRRLLLVLAGIAVNLLLILALAWLGWRAFVDHQYLHRGIGYGEPSHNPWTSVYPLGVNVSLEQYENEEELKRALSLAREAGFRWVRQEFPWAEIEAEKGRYRWHKWDDIVAAIREEGLDLVAVLNTSPPWAREAMDADNPLAPAREFPDFWGFATAFASRYGDSIRFYQVWDEPNIYPHWGERYVNPLSYVYLLKGAYGAIRQADREAVVLNAALAPNAEEGGRNMSDLLFLQEMYEAGAKDYFDILAIEPYGLWYGADDRQVDPHVTNFSRAVLLREVMLHNKDDKPVWAVAFGWNALPSDWKGRPSLWGSDSQEIQAQRTIDALERGLDEWPWIGVLFLSHLQPNAPPDAPVWGFSLLEKDFTPRLLYQELSPWAKNLPPRSDYYPGDAWAARYEGSWRVKDGMVLGPSQGDGLSLSFKGTRLDVVLLGPFYAQASVDENRPVEIAIAQGERRITLASGLTDEVHRLNLTVTQASSGGLQAFVVRRDPNFAGYYGLLAGLLAALLVVSWTLGWLVSTASFQWLWWAISQRYHRRPDWQKVGLVALSLAGYYFLPWWPLNLLFLALAALLVYLRLDLGLAFVALSIPFFLYPKAVLGKAFSLVETLTLLCFAAWLLKNVVGFCGAILQPRLYHKDSSFEVQEVSWRRWLLRESPGAVKSRVLEILLSMRPLDWGVLFLVILGSVSLLFAENFGVAARELRVVILESAIFYLLLREVPDRKGLWHILDGLILAALIVSLYGLYQYFFTSDAIVAEGVRRIRGVYASPNNLSLFLGRIVPISLAIALFASGRRRTLYGLASLPILLCLFLSFSRGSWLLGLPVAILFLGLMRGRKALAYAIGAVLVGLMALVPLAGLERISSLINLEAGTTLRRLKLWEATLNMLRDHPVFGVGLDNFLYHYPRYILPGAMEEPDLSHPHNIILHWWVSLGVLGVASLVWLLLTFFRLGFSLYSHFSEEVQDSDSQALVLGLLASMVYTLAHGLVDQSFFLVDLAFVFLATMGIMRRIEILRLRGGWL